MITKPKGCHDIYGMEAKKWNYVSRLIDEVCDRYNYQLESFCSITIVNISFFLMGNCLKIVSIVI